MIGKIDQKEKTIKGVCFQGASALSNDFGVFIAKQEMQKPKDYGA